VVPLLEVRVLRLGHGLDAALEPFLGRAAVVLLDRLPAGLVPERHRVAALARLDRHVDQVADAREAVPRILDEVGAHADLVAAEAALHRPAAQVAMALDQRDPLALVGEQRGAAEPGGPGADDHGVVLHEF
jgi:hypothetical protein